ncbi:hypothetical protein FOZ63_025169 [Perkinsus olseni]|uniref:Uncharacterized protein n=1 Tax=Perkinsus olseni TaxID=32597 RepID=A0A7J6RGR3_PEROL|nr:hypothetical protein FOZ63_025169 [Perkinsus olseni]KAF4739975.1 hypothetical protein FOZ62_015318 [Perkinsus olseni]
MQLLRLSNSVQLGILELREKKEKKRPWLNRGWQMTRAGTRHIETDGPVERREEDGLTQNPGASSIHRRDTSGTSGSAWLRPTLGDTAEIVRRPAGILERSVFPQAWIIIGRGPCTNEAVDR